MSGRNHTPLLKSDQPLLKRTLPLLAMVVVALVAWLVLPRVNG